MLLSFLAVLALSTHSLAIDTVVNLGYTKYRGYQENGINKYKGMRYAAPPLGDLRFRAPKPPVKVENGTEEDATAFKPACIGTDADPSSTADKEDCLFLNLYTPSDATEDSKLPVYVFIQGGGFQANSNRNYDGEGLIKASGGNIVVINFNYRVGLFGFLAGKEVVEDGDTNAGLLDQRELFKWVQQYITKFGGDPDHVTIGGCSAGAGSDTLHQTAYGGRDDGLFHAIAGESQSFPAQFTVEELQYQYDYVTSTTGCDNYGSGSSIECLRQLPLATIQTANTVIPFPGGSGLNPLFAWGNAIDGTFTQDYTYSSFASGNFIRVPSIYGDDSNEGTVFAPRDRAADYAEVNDFLRANFPALTSAQLDKIDSFYPLAEQFPDSDPYWRTAANAYGEIRYICPGIFISREIAKATAGTSDYPSRTSAWNYRYDVRDPDLYADGLGTTHTEEVGAIWGTEFIGGSAPKSYNTTNAGIVDVMQGYWTSFIRSYDPNRFRAVGTPEWRPVQVGDVDGFERIRFNTTMSNMEKPSDEQLRNCQYLWSIARDIQQ